MDDWQLLREYVQAGSQLAFAQLVERHVRWVHGRCARQLSDVHLAEDATQAVFLLLSQKSARLPKGTSISGWLFRAAQLTSKNMMKAERRRAKREVRAAADTQYQATQRENEPAGQNESALMLAIDSALARLRSQDRELLLLRFYGNRTVAEIGAELGISVDAAGKRFTRSIDALRQALVDQGTSLPSVGVAQAIMRAADAAHAQTIPARLAAWIAAGASPGTVSPTAVAITRAVDMKNLFVVAAFALGVLALVAFFSWNWGPKGAARAERIKIPTSTLTRPPPVPAAVVPVGPGVRQLVGHRNWITAVAISPDGRFAASRSLTQLFRWDLSTATAIAPPLAMVNQSFCVAVGNNGVVAAIDGPDIIVFDSAVAKLRRIAGVRSTRSLPWSIALSPDASVIALGGTDGVMRLVHRQSGQIIRTFSGYTNIVTTLAFSPDGKTLITGGRDGEIRLWDVATGTLKQRMTTHTSMVLAVSFSQDSASALSFTRNMSDPTTQTIADGFIRVWDVTTGEERAALPMPLSITNAATFTSDGARVAAVDAESLIVFDITGGREISRRRLIPGLSCGGAAATFSLDGRRFLTGGDFKHVGELYLIDLGDELAGPPR